MKIKEILGHLVERSPATHPARTAFYHYLKNVCQSEDNFSVETLDSFYDRAMIFQHWREHRSELGKIVSQDLKEILGADLEGALHSHQIQWLEIEQDRDFNELIDAENSVLQKRSEEIRCLNFEPDRKLRIRRGNDGSTRVEVKGRVAFIEGHRLHLTRPVTSLFYTAGLELKEDVDQIIQLSPLRLVRFQVKDELVQGQILQGMTFAKVESITGHLEDYPEVFFALKKLEKLFINPETDPFYIALTAQLEKAIHLIRIHHPDQQMIATEVLKRAESFARAVFADDNRLNKLISTLRFNMGRTEASQLNPVTQVEKCQILKPLNPRTPTKFV